MLLASNEQTFELTRCTVYGPFRDSLMGASERLMGRYCKLYYCTLFSKFTVIYNQLVNNVWLRIL
jgi:hypothetical protein